MVPAPKILVVQDVREAHRDCEDLLAQAGYAPCFAGAGTLNDVDLTAFKVVLLDVGSANNQAMALLDEIKERQPGVEVIGIASEPSVEGAKAAVQHGAFDVVFEPLTSASVAAVVSKALEHKAWFVCPVGPEGSAAAAAHDWLEYEGAGQVSIGLERSFLEVIGTPLYVELPLEGAQVAQGGTLFRVLTETGEIQNVASPVTGRVLRVNEALLWDVDAVRQVGWVVRLELARKPVEKE